MRPNFLRCELKFNEVAPVLLAGGRVKKKKTFFFSSHGYVSALMVVVDNKILLSGSFLRVLSLLSLSLPVSACLSVCTRYGLCRWTISSSRWRATIMMSRPPRPTHTNPYSLFYSYYLKTLQGLLCK